MAAQDLRMSKNWPPNSKQEVWTNTSVTQLALQRRGKENKRPEDEENGCKMSSSRIKHPLPSCIKNSCGSLLWPYQTGSGKQSLLNGWGVHRFCCLLLTYWLLMSPEKGVNNCLQLFIHCFTYQLLVHSYKSRNIKWPWLNSVDLAFILSK